MKAQSISLTTIIVAVLCLVVLVVLIFIFRGKMGLFNNSAEQCGIAGGTCVTESECSAEKQRIQAECPDSKPVCCGIFEFGDDETSGD